MEKKQPLIAITMGDPAGIGPEVLVKYAVSEIKAPAPFCRFIAIGDAGVLKGTAERLGIQLEFNILKNLNPDALSPASLNVIDLQNVDSNEFSLGQVSECTGRASVEFILKGVDLSVSGKVDAITTAPVSKEAINLAGFKYPGHTELLAEHTRTSDFAMMMVGGNIRVVLATTHLPLHAVAKEIKRELVERIIRLAHRSLTFYEGTPPSIAVAALNPHAGDGGIIGTEEIEEISPAVEKCAKEGIEVTGPLPADSLFVKAKQGKYDAVVVMYHDQGLIPVKMEGFGSGVNVTLGLPIIRTSVDHGVALDIAKKGIADSSSLNAAVRYAAEMVKKKKANAL